MITLDYLVRFLGWLFGHEVASGFISTTSFSKLFIALFSGFRFWSFCAYFQWLEIQELSKDEVKFLS